MQPGLKDNEYVVVNKVAYLFHPPERGDVVVFHFPLNTRVDYIKRVIGVPGDTIKIDGTHVWVNGVLLDEQRYVSMPSNPKGSTWKVPPDKYYVMGDNRPVSDDSRYWDYVPRNFIVGKAVAVYWPINQWKFIDSYPSVYAKVKVSK